MSGKGSTPRPLSVPYSVYADNWSSIDMRKKLTSEEWCKLKKVIVYDPDGWDRSPEGWKKSWNEKITEEEFEKRLDKSTISNLNYKTTPQ